VAMDNSKNKVIGIIDYKLSNLNSVKNCLKKLNFDFTIITCANDFVDATHYILPGVGSFNLAMRNLKNMNIISKLKENIDKKKSKILGICLGMQLLFEKSYEDGETIGLGIIKGEVKKLENFGDLKVPNIGWLRIKLNKNDKFLNGINSDSFFYFVHSYACYSKYKQFSLATLKYQNDFDVIIRNDNIFGLQFHPEKSQEPGLRLFKNFIDD
jgi:imidazole glycerol-phosphate synthase subunit HisH|tara:strand:- start:254 stop:889 length:636 start_codon:yes stop_codon:yes gene_type:complete